MQWHLDLGGPGQSRVLAPASALASANAMQCCRVSWAININKGTYSRGHAAEFEGNGSPKMSQRKQCRMRGRVSILWIDNLRGMNNRTTHNSMTKYKSDFMKLIVWNIKEHLNNFSLAWPWSGFVPDFQFDGLVLSTVVFGFLLFFGFSLLFTRYHQFWWWL